MRKAFKLAKAAFAQRRKTINNNYQNFFKDGKKNKETIRQWLESAGIDPKDVEKHSRFKISPHYMNKEKFSELTN